MGSIRPQHSRFALWLALLLLSLAHPARAQQDLQSQSSTSLSGGDRGSPSNLFPNRPVTTSMDTGEPLDDHGGAALPAGRSTGLLKMGHLSLLSASVFYEYDSNF